MRTPHLWLITAVALLVAFSAYGKPFTFTAIPDQNESRLRERFDKVANYLAERLEVEVRYIPVKSYAASVTAFKNNEVQLAWFGGLSGVQARAAVPGARAIAQGDEDQLFVTYFLAHMSTGLSESGQFPQGITGRSFIFGSKGSTSGRLMPEFFIRQHLGGAPETVFSRVGFSGSHSRTIALVQAGAYEVGAVNYKVWETELAEGKIDAQHVRMIWRTPPYPDYNWTLQGDLDETWGAGFEARVTAALLEMDDPDLLAAFPREKFVPAKNEDYASIKEIAQIIGLMD